jgi:hypothetical protein
VGGAPPCTLTGCHGGVIGAQLTRPHARAQFDKRTYCGGQYAPGPRKLERIPEPPQWKEGLHLQARHARVCLRARPCPLADTQSARTCFFLQSFFQNGVAISTSGLELMRLEVKTFNDAVDTLTELPKARRTGNVAHTHAYTHGLSSPESRR